MSARPQQSEDPRETLREIVRALARAAAIEEHSRAASLRRETVPAEASTETGK